MIKKSKKIFSFCLFLFVSFTVFSQEQDNTPESYSKSEFPVFVQDLRRGEIITIGSYPFTLAAVGTGYSLYRYFANDMDSSYMPNPFAKNYSNASLSKKEQATVMLTAAGLSIGIGLADFIVTKVVQGIEAKNMDEKDPEELDPDITIIPIYKEKVGSE